MSEGAAPSSTYQATKARFIVASLDAADGSILRPMASRLPVLPRCDWKGRGLRTCINVSTIADIRPDSNPSLIRIGIFA